MVAALALSVALNPVALSHRIQPSLLPCQPVTGLSKDGETWLIGGLRGLYIGSPGGKWELASDQAVRSITAAAGATWAIYGNGAVDKVDIRHNLLYFDTLSDVKRPWVDCLTVSGRNLLFGGQGGWMLKSPLGVSERYPSELKGLPVNAIAQVGTTLWVGTQDGAFACGSGTVHRFGFGAGLKDTWITALIPSDGSVIAGSASGGLARISDQKVETISSPTMRVRSLCRWKGHLVLGSLDGTWIRSESDWFKIADGETYFLSALDGELVVGSPSGLSFYS